jgi:hypothetical protein
MSRYYPLPEYHLAAYQKIKIPVGRTSAHRNIRSQYDNMLPDILIIWYSAFWFSDILIPRYVEVVPVDKRTQPDIIPG